VDAYWDLLSPAIQSDTVRNIMDMKSNMGSFATALNDKDVWVMNVVPEDGPNTLKLIYDRGLMGAVHSWCEAFSTYPRTYDLFLCFFVTFFFHLYKQTNFLFCIILNKFIRLCFEVFVIY
ncbi:unnamed protein product, partial [Brassica oleracea var. botrytis]